MNNKTMFDFSFLAKMNNSDWTFFFIFSAALLGEAFLFDAVLHLIKGYYIIASGVMICIYLLYNRIMAREKEETQA